MPAPPWISSSPVRMTRLRACSAVSRWCPVRRMPCWPKRVPTSTDHVPSAPATTRTWSSPGPVVTIQRSPSRRSRDGGIGDRLARSSRVEAIRATVSSSIRDASRAIRRTAADAAPRSSARTARSMSRGGTSGIQSAHPAVARRSSSAARSDPPEVDRSSATCDATRPYRARASGRRVTRSITMPTPAAPRGATAATSGHARPRVGAVPSLPRQSQPRSGGRARAAAAAVRRARS